MRRKNKIISSVVLISFLLNTAVSNLAFGQTLTSSPSDKLAAQSKFSNIQSVENKDMGDIELWFAAALNCIHDQGFDIAVGDPATIKETLQRFANVPGNLPGNTIFHLEGAQFFIHEIPLPQDGVLKIKVTRKDFVHGARTYIIEYSPDVQRLDVYPEGKPKQRMPEDRSAVDRYVQHEKGIDTVIRYAHENGLVKEPLKDRFDYSSWVIDIFRRLNIKVANPKKLIPVEDRKFMLIKVTRELKDLMLALPKATLVGADKKEHEIAYVAHSSNNAVYVFVSEDDFDILTNPDREVTTEMVSIIRDNTCVWLVYELGVMLGLVPHRFIHHGIDGSLQDPVNHVNERSFILMENPNTKFPELKLNIVDLDTNLATRDYAGGTKGMFMYECTPGDTIDINHSLVLTFVGRDFTNAEFSLRSSLVNFVHIRCGDDKEHFEIVDKKVKVRVNFSEGSPDNVKLIIEYPQGMNVRYMKVDLNQQPIRSPDDVAGASSNANRVVALNDAGEAAKLRNTLSTNVVGEKGIEWNGHVPYDELVGNAIAGDVAALVDAAISGQNDDAKKAIRENNAGLRKKYDEELAKAQAAAEERSFIEEITRCMNLGNVAHFYVNFYHRGDLRHGNIKEILEKSSAINDLANGAKLFLNDINRWGSVTPEDYETGEKYLRIRNEVSELKEMIDPADSGVKSHLIELLGRYETPSSADASAPDAQAVVGALALVPKDVILQSMPEKPGEVFGIPVSMVDITSGEFVAHGISRTETEIITPIFEALARFRDQFNGEFGSKIINFEVMKRGSAPGRYNLPIIISFNDESLLGEQIHVDGPSINGPFTVHGSYRANQYSMFDFVNLPSIDNVQLKELPQVCTDLARDILVGLGLRGETLEKPLNSPEDYADALLQWPRYIESVSNTSLFKPVWNTDETMLGKINDRDERVTLTPSVIVAMEQYFMAAERSEEERENRRTVYCIAMLNDCAFPEDTRLLMGRYDRSLDIVTFVRTLSAEERGRFIKIAETVHVSAWICVDNVLDYCRAHKIEEVPIADEMQKATTNFNAILNEDGISSIIPAKFVELSAEDLPADSGGAPRELNGARTNTATGTAEERNGINYFDQLDKPSQEMITPHDYEFGGNPQDVRNAIAAAALGEIDATELSRKLYVGEGTALTIINNFKGRVNRKLPAQEPAQAAAAKRDGEDQELSKLTAEKNFFALKTETLRRIAGDFRTDLESRGKAGSSLSDIVTERGIPTGEEKGNYIYIDLGGTNLRVGLAILEGNRIISERKIERHVKVSKKVMTEGGKELFRLIAKTIREFVDEQHLSGELRPGFTFSFVMKKEGLQSGIITAECNVKGWNFNDVIGKDVTVLLREALPAVNLENVEVAALVNDTEGVRDTGAYLNSKTIAGGVYGTGHNTAMRDNQGRSVNLESGAFDKLAQNEDEPGVRALDEEIDRLSVNPGVHPLEKRLSGKYIGPLFGIRLEAEFKAGRLFKDHSRNLPKIFTEHNYESDSYQGIKAEHLTKVEELWKSGGVAALKKYIRALGILNPSDQDAGIVRDIAHDIMLRSAQLGAATFAGILMEREGTNAPAGEYAYAVDGSILKYPGYIDMMENTLTDIFGAEYAKKLEVFEAKDGAGIGAAITAMLVLTQGKAQAAEIPTQAAVGTGGFDLRNEMPVEPVVGMEPAVEQDEFETERALRKIGLVEGLVQDAGKEIPTAPETRYTLLVDNNVYQGDEYRQDIKGYVKADSKHIGAAERFNLEGVNTSDVDNIILHIKDPAKTVVQISRELTQDELTKLNKKAPGVRIVRVDTTYFKNGELNTDQRRDCRFDLYGMMLLARQVTQEDMEGKTNIYQSLAFMIDTHYSNGEEAVADKYINALLKGDLEGMSFIIKHNLSYRPAGRWRIPDYHTIAATLISA